MKSRRPDKRLVMNAVGQYGQENSISKTDVDFLYTEVWGSREGDTGNPGFTALSDVITQNDSWGGGKETVLAAYMNYDYGKLGNSTFNTPGVLMAMSAIYAWGGSILNMGEHMLCNEYFPNSNLSMTGELKQAVIRYYDFLTAYVARCRRLDRGGCGFSCRYGVVQPMASSIGQYRDRGQKHGRCGICTLPQLQRCVSFELARFGCQSNRTHTLRGLASPNFRERYRPRRMVRHARC